jgi:hypothetical protein
MTVEINLPSLRPGRARSGDLPSFLWAPRQHAPQAVRRGNYRVFDSVQELNDGFYHLSSIIPEKF